MTNVSRRLCTVGAAVLIAFSSAALSAQTAAVTGLDRQLSRIDFAVSGAGEFTTNTQGSTSPNQTVSLQPSSTLGAVVTLRYTKSPLIGGEFNYGYARYTEDFLYTNLTPTGSSQAVLGVQTNVSEYTFGYLAHTPRYFGVQPFASAGAGSLAFRPTKGGGQGFQPQARAAYYYSVGAEDLVYGEHFGLRLGFRQVFALAPDYETTYLRDHKRSITSEPTFGFFLRF